ncbi:MAG: thiazole synthase [Bilophila sp.]
MDTDSLVIGGVTLRSRLFIGTGKYGTDDCIPDVVAASGAHVITVALRRVDLGHTQDNVLSHIPPTMQLLPNTSGARTADEAVRIAHLSRAAGCGDWIKIEVMSDTRHLLPDGYETAKATERLVKEGFIVLPYMNPDLYVARDLVNAGAAAVMPLGAPIGSNRGLQTREMIRILIEEIHLPIVVDAGIGKPSHACEAMEMGAAACLVNTAIATAGDPVRMAAAFGAAVRAGRDAWLAKAGAVLHHGASASSPLTGFLHDTPATAQTGAAS